MSMHANMSISTHQRQNSISLRVEFHRKLILYTVYWKTSSIGMSANAANRWVIFPVHNTQITIVGILIPLCMCAIVSSMRVLHRHKWQRWLFLRSPTNQRHSGSQCLFEKKSACSAESIQTRVVWQVEMCTLWWDCRPCFLSRLCKGWRSWRWTQRILFTN